MSGKLLAVYIFGSVARRDSDTRSDLDLLAIVEDGAGKVPEECVLMHVPEDFRHLETSISWYGRNRMAAMFSNGELFAWHLFQEAVALYESEPVISQLGRPSPYQGALEDVESFQQILSEIPQSLNASGENAIYEMGLVYVCLRNICMSASAVLCSQPDFSRYSPFELGDFPPAPMARADYDTAMVCRMAGQRGFVPPMNIDAEHVYRIYSELAPWVEALRSRLEVEHGRRQEKN